MFAKTGLAASAGGDLPVSIDPMLPASARGPFDSAAHIFEVMWEGARTLVFLDGGRVRLQDRYVRDVTWRYPELQAIAAQVPAGGIVLDGEAVVLDGAGRPDFRRLCRRLAAGDPADARALVADAPVCFQAYDILYRERRPVIGEPLRQRKELLRDTVRPGAALSVPDFVARDGTAFFEAAREHGLAGIVAKEVDSPYQPGQRSRSWLQIAIQSRAEFVVGGSTYGGPWKGARIAKRRGPIASLLLGLYDGSGQLQYAGEVTGGFDEGEELARQLDEVATHNCPFAEEPRLERLVFWCRPELTATVSFAGVTPAGRLQFPVFVAVRPDVPPRACLLEDVTDLA